MTTIEARQSRTPPASRQNPVWAIARREWLTLSRDPKLTLFVGVVALLLPLSIYVNSREYVTQRLHAMQVKTRVLEEGKLRGGKLTGRDIEQALRVVRMPPNGFSLVRGIQVELPAYWDVGPAGVRIGPRSEGYLAPEGETSLDLEFIVRVILGLYAVWLGIEALALERERRTLHGLMAQPVSLLTIFAGKLAAAAAILAMMSVGLGLIAGAVEVTLQRSSSAWSVIPFVSIASFWYLLSCYLLGFVLSHFGGSFQRALTIALSVWIFVNVVSLPLAGSLSRAIADQRPRFDFEGEMQRAYEATARESERRLGAELLERAGRHKVFEIEKDTEMHRLAGAALEPVWREYAEQWGNDLIAREAHWQRGAERLDRVTGLISTLSPGLAFRRFSAHVSGTGLGNGLAWHEAVINYQAMLYKALFGDRPRLMLRVPTDSGYALMTFQRRPDLLVSEVSPFSPPDQRRFPLAQFVLLPAQCAVLLIVSAVFFARTERS